MGFEIKLGIGGGKEMVMRGCSDGTVELCEYKQSKNRDTGEVTAGWVGTRFYADAAMAMIRVAAMRVGSCAATTLTELATEIKNIRKDIKKELGVTADENHACACSKKMLPPESRRQDVRAVSVALPLSGGVHGEQTGSDVRDADNSGLCTVPAVESGTEGEAGCNDAAV